MKRLWLIPLIMLGACANEPAAITPRLVVAPPLPARPFLKNAIPVSVLSCKPEPDGTAVKTVRQTAIYILDLKATGGECRQKLKSVKALIQGEQ